MKNYLLVTFFAMGLIGCGANANLTFSTNNGNCYQFNSESTTITESAPAPYCMQVIMTNNGGGNNFVNSTSASVNSINMNLYGATNILYPATSSSMDPNNCLNSSLNPGSSCTFYMQINQESYPVNQAESASLVLTYTVQNTLFGSGTSSGSSTLNFYEVTNLYIPQNNGNISILNAGSTPFSTVTGLFKTSTIDLLSSAMDNSVFGYLYLGGSSGIFLYGDKTASASIGVSNINSANNLLNLSANIYATPGSLNSGVFKWTISSASWANSAQSVFSLIPQPNTNVHAISSTTGAMYLASGTQVYNCNSASTTSSNACVPEAVTFPGGIITAMTFQQLLSVSNSYTGLYAGASGGLYAESSAGTTQPATNIWVPVNYESAAITNSINTLTIDLNGNLYAGDNDGNIWLINTTSGSNNAYKLYTMNAGVQLMRVDTNAKPNELYIIGNNWTLYSCPLLISSGVMSCTPTIVPNSSNLTNNPIGMRIGSELRTSL